MQDSLKTSFKMPTLLSQGSYVLNRINCCLDRLHYMSCSLVNRHCSFKAQTSSVYQKRKPPRSNIPLTHKTNDRQTIRCDPPSNSIKLSWRLKIPR